jgi:DNA-binding HxlR family transcriptional regulator
MLGRTYDAEVCSAARTLELVGERWSLLIVRNALFAGSTRYNDFRNRLGIATNILKTRGSPPSPAPFLRHSPLCQSVI